MGKLNCMDCLKKCNTINQGPRGLIHVFNSKSKKNRVSDALEVGYKKILQMELNPLIIIKMNFFGLATFVAKPKQI